MSRESREWAASSSAADGSPTEQFAEGWCAAGSGDGDDDERPSAAHLPRRPPLTEAELLAQLVSLVSKLVEMGKKGTYYYENIEGGHGGAADNKQRAFMSVLAFDFLEQALGGSLKIAE